MHPWKIASAIAFAALLFGAPSLASAPETTFNITVAAAGSATPPPSLRYDLLTEETAVSLWPAYDSDGTGAIDDIIPTTTTTPDTFSTLTGITLGSTPGPLSYNSSGDPNTAASCGSGANATTSSQTGPSGSFTLGASVYEVSGGSGGPVFKISNNNTPFIGVWLGSDNKPVGDMVGTGVTTTAIESSTAMTTAAWNRINYRYDSSKNLTTLFLNGVSVASASASGLNTGAFAPWELCHTSVFPSNAVDVPSTTTFSGKVAWLSVVDAAVSDADIATEYKSMSATSTVDPTPAPVVAGGSPTAHPAFAAAAVLDNIGADTHYDHGASPAYSYPTQFIKGQLRMGIHQLRDAFHDTGYPSETTLCSDGMKFITGFNIGDSIATMRSTLDGIYSKGLINCVDHIEGPNEPDTNGTTTWAADTLTVQTDMYDAIRTGTDSNGLSYASKYAALKIYAAPLANGANSYTALHNEAVKEGITAEHYVDYSNTHIGGYCDAPPDQTAAEASTYFGSNGTASAQFANARIAYPDIPGAITEDPAEGGMVAATGRQATRCYTPEDVSAKYLPRGIFHDLNTGFVVDYIYLYDMEPPDDSFGGEGVVDQNGNGTYEYYTVANLLAVLNSQNPTPNHDATAAPLTFGYKAGPGSNASIANVEFVPIRQPNGDYDLLYWIQGVDWNPKLDESNCTKSNGTGTSASAGVPGVTQGICVSGDSTLPSGTTFVRKGLDLTVAPQSITVTGLSQTFDNAVNYVNSEVCNAEPAWHDLVAGQKEPAFDYSPQNDECYPYVPTSVQLEGGAVNLTATDMIQDLHISANPFTPVSKASQAPMTPATPIATPAGSSSLATYSPWPLPTVTPAPGTTPREVFTSTAS